MKTRKPWLLAVASACMLAALPAQAYLVVNGGFEDDPATFRTTGWSVASGTPNITIAAGIPGIIAGALLLLPFAASTFRMPRKNRMA